MDPIDEQSLEPTDEATATEGDTDRGTTGQEGTKANPTDSE